MGMDSVLQRIKKSFTPRKRIDFDEVGIHFELEPLTALEEVKVTESLKDIDDNIYIAALKKHSLACSIRKMVIDEDNGETTVFDLSNEFIEYLDKDGEPKTKSRFLYMLDYLSQWPNAVIDVLFDAFTNMHLEIDAKVRQQGKFETFRVSEIPPEDKEPKLKKVAEEDEESTEGLTEAERLEKKVNKELEEADLKLAQND